MRKAAKGSVQVESATLEEALALEYQAKSVRGMAWRILALVYGQDDQREIDSVRS